MSVMAKMEKAIIKYKGINLINKHYLKISFEDAGEAQSYVDDMKQRINNYNTDLDVNVSIELVGKDKKIALLTGMNELCERDYEKFVSALKRSTTIESDGKRETVEDILKRKKSKKDESSIQVVDSTGETEPSGSVDDFLEAELKDEIVQSYDTLVKFVMKKFNKEEEEAKTAVKKWIDTQVNKQTAMFDESAEYGGLITWK